MVPGVASPMPISIWVVMVAEMLKGFQVGPDIAFPITIWMAVASPIARPIPSMRPANIPDWASETTILKSVWVLVAPKAKEALIRLGLTDFIAVTDINIMVGIDIIESTITPERREAPPEV